jgi:hypothetical protein
MTFTPAELDLSPEAAARLEDYLAQVRGALAGMPDVNPDEIDADVREHIGNELHATPRPVPLPALEAVLAKLGPPSQWGTPAGPPPFDRVRQVLARHLAGARAVAVERARRVRFALWNGPEEWRLAYLSFGVLALGALTMVVFPLALVVSYVLSRAGLAVARERGIDLGAGRKWLLYPSVVIVNLVLLVAAVAWPAGLGAAAAEEVSGAVNRVRHHDRPEAIPHPWGYMKLPDRERKERWAAQIEADRALLATIPVAPDFAPAAAGLFVGVGALALWLTVLGCVGAKYPHAVRAVFVPLCDRFESRHGRGLAVVSFVVLLAWCAAAREVVAALA